MIVLHKLPSLPLQRLSRPRYTPTISSKSPIAETPPQGALPATGDFEEFPQVDNVDSLMCMCHVKMGELWESIILF